MDRERERGYVCMIKGKIGSGDRRNAEGRGREMRKERGGGER